MPLLSPVLPPHKVKAQVSAIQMVCSKVLQVELTPVEPASFAFIPGQYINIIVPPGVVRPYSICSSASDSTKLSLVIAVGHEGVCANYFKSLSVGIYVEFIGPVGKFQLHYPLPHSLEFIATGTGIAPFVPMLYQLVTDNYSGRVKLEFGVRTEQDIFLTEVLQDFTHNLAHFDYTLWLSRPSQEPLDPNLTPQKKGRLTTVLPSKTNKNAHYYICGHPDMVTEVKTYLEETNAIPVTNIFFEEFTRTPGKIS